RNAYCTRKGRGAKEINYKLNCPLSKTLNATHRRTLMRGVDHDERENNDDYAAAAATRVDRQTGSVGSSRKLKMYPGYPVQAQIPQYGTLAGQQCMYRSYPNLHHQSLSSSSSVFYPRAGIHQATPAFPQHYRQQQHQPPPPPPQHYTQQQQQASLLPQKKVSATLPGTAAAVTTTTTGTTSSFPAKKNNCYYCNNNINLTCTCLSSSALGYFYSTSRTLHSSAPSTLNRRRSSIRNPPGSVSFAADSHVLASTGGQQYSYSSLPRHCRGYNSQPPSRIPSTVAVGVQAPSPPSAQSAAPPIVKTPAPAPARRSQQHQESQVDEEMLGLVGDGKPLRDDGPPGDGEEEEEEEEEEDDELEDPNGDSPAMSASPPPAPPPLPPPIRNGCQRCRFSMASANSTLNRSHPHLAHLGLGGTLGSGSIGSGTLPRSQTGLNRNGGTLERNHHMAASSGHLHTAGTGAAGGAGGGTYPAGYDRNRLLDEEDSAYPALLERELHSLHRNVPALRRAGVDTTAIRQHFYPDGGWGWIVCGVAFLAHVLTTGFQLSFGLLLLYAIRHLGHEVNTETG
uniref:Uncharacterized protein n=1 Tax=Anopheles albimanus TaxID=7167 RepID=A0A182F5E6_ANOAL